MCKYDYRYILLDLKRMYVAHRHFYFLTDKEAIKLIPELEKGTGYICLEIEKSENYANDINGNDYYKSIWCKGH